MVEKSIELYKLQRIEDMQGELRERFGKLEERFLKIDDRLVEIEKDIAKIQGAQEKRTSEWFTHFAAPALAVLTAGAIGGAITGYINLNTRLSKIESYVQTNGGLIGQLQIQKSAANPTDPKDIATANRPW